MIRNASLVVVLTACVNVTLAQEFPLWERLLSHYGGKTDETPVPSMKMGDHMQMSLKADPAPGDAARATKILAAAAAVLSRYRDVETAVRDGSLFSRPAVSVRRFITPTIVIDGRSSSTSITHDRGRFSTSAPRRDCRRSV